MNQLEKNITDAIKTAKRDGVVGMSMQNLKQVTRTSGLKISVYEYHRTFEEVAKQVAKRIRFSIIEGGEA
jgi:hypothetical protein|tara:strand:+ start:2476 stop:2685 length:210 start_codon:yes stop_codon:yes gene_type:complete